MFWSAEPRRGRATDLDASGTDPKHLSSLLPMHAVHVLYRWQPFRAFPGERRLISPQDPVRRDMVQIVESVPYVFRGSGSTLRLKPEAEKLDLNFCIRTPSFFWLFLAWNDTLWLLTCQSWSFHLNPNSNLQISCLCWENSKFDLIRLNCSGLKRECRADQVS